MAPHTPRIAFPLWTVLLSATVVSWSGDALALNPGMHQTVTLESCRRANLPSDFCQRAGREAYVTDSLEFEDPHVHAQAAPDESACEAAAHTIERVASLGAELRAAVDDLAVSRTREYAAAVTVAFGRAVHTIQDNCAHEGMPNAQHAWYSLSDFCEQAELSPDKLATSIECAERETDRVMGMVAEVVRAAGVAKALGELTCAPEADTAGEGARANDPCQVMSPPSPQQGCSFLGEADGWDGVDRRWNSAVVGEVLQAAFGATINGAAPPSADVCAGEPATIANPAPRADVDTSAGPQSCAKAGLLCLGKADDAADSLYGDEVYGAPDASDPSAALAGCAIVGSRPLLPARGWGWPLLVAAMTLLGVRRRS